MIEVQDFIVLFHNFTFLLFYILSLQGPAIGLVLFSVCKDSSEIQRKKIRIYPKNHFRISLDSQPVTPPSHKLPKWAWLQRLIHHEKNCPKWLRKSAFSDKSAFEHDKWCHRKVKFYIS
ncbi:MAG: hypothetical protein PUD15_05390 [Prevotella sp.]|uniref:hypothetical protein n=1 Tax=Prevotella sp. AGR2160 TaxID=1280674 RepID=UPI000688382E|nr:hypothetical protein [Prevotella sp. AGR2160]MDD5861979.1 hypothetical protein [Prevotella sp.]